MKRMPPGTPTLQEVAGATERFKAASTEFLASAEALAYKVSAVHSARREVGFERVNDSADVRAWIEGMTVLRQGVAAATESLVDAASRAGHELIELERRCPRDEGN